MGFSTKSFPRKSGRDGWIELDQKLDRFLSQRQSLRGFFVRYPHASRK